MGATGTFGLPYPDVTSTVDWVADMQALATAVDTNMVNVFNPPAAAAYRTTNLTIGNGALTDVTLTTEEFDNTSMFAPTSTIITTPLFGLYAVTGSAQFTANATGGRQIVLLKNGVQVPGAGCEVPTSGGTFTTRLTLATTVQCAVSDQLKLQVLQTSGGNLDILNARFSVVRVSG